MQFANLTLLAAVFDAQLIRWVVWVGLVMLTVTLLLLVRTRWGQSQPLGKCIVLSLLAHLLLAIYISTVRIVTATVGSDEGKGVQVALVDDTAADSQPDRAAPDAWEKFTEPSLDETLTAAADSAAQAPAEAPELPQPQRLAPVAPPPTASLPKPAPLPSEEAAPPKIVDQADAPKAATPAKDAQPIEIPAPADNPKEADPVPPPDPQPAQPAPTGATAGGAGKDSAPAPQADVKPLVPIAGRPAGEGGGPAAVPDALKLRGADHSQIAKGLGATQQSEAAVSAALKWLAANQSTGGRWEPRATGAGSGKASDGQDRFAAGSSADTGITGLALLAFLASGNTHLQGDHKLAVRHGLEFLLGMQDADGNLGASNNMYEKMYCHAMATCALSEAYAMSKDDRLLAPVRRAIGYTVRAQDRTSGGWRYRPADPGDTSQLGWQVMALKSGQLAGIEISEQTRGGIERFLKSVALGKSSGLACYQPVRPVASRSMTAEALVCRQFLGMIDRPAALSEASSYLLQEAPGAGTTNFYYWYYATLAMYQLQGEGWPKWNEAMQKTLIGAQRRDGQLAGSWDPDPVWGGCGGRVYSTALGTLCLEVYYRFLPLYVEAASRERFAK